MSDQSLIVKVPEKTGQPQELAWVELPSVWKIVEKLKRGDESVEALQILRRDTFLNTLTEHVEAAARRDPAMFEKMFPHGEVKLINTIEIPISGDYDD